MLTDLKTLRGILPLLFTIVRFALNYVLDISEYVFELGL